MKTRVITAAVLVPLLLLVLFAAPKIVMVILFSLLCAFSAIELLYNTGLVKHFRLVIYTVVIAALVPVWCYFGMNKAWALAAILLFMVLLFMEAMLSDMKLRFDRICICLAGGLLIPFLLSSLVRIIMPGNGRYVILIPFVVAFLSDSGAYFIGCRFGKHKLAPLISPKKSVEGVFGGVAFAVIGMLLYVLVLQILFKASVNYGYALVYAIIGTAIGVFGDLCFSVIKRQTGIKDYGNLFPGHGGVLDRFDSMLFVCPLIELLLEGFPVVVVPV